MLLLILFVPLMSFFVCFFLGGQIGRFGCFFFSIFATFISFTLSWLFFFTNKNVSVIELGSWLKLFFLNIQWNFLFDSLSTVMLVVVLTVSFFVHFFSYYYMYNDPYSNKFMSFLSLFTFFMIILVVSSNFLILFLGWEGVGLCSFLLISFWSSRLQANKSAMKAMLINRVGDFFILTGIMLVFFLFKSLDFLVVFSSVNVYLLKTVKLFSFKLKLLDLICFFLFLGAITKSAQIFFHGWLPDAMEGPTPVSALIHAATMVTAGVFLIIRLSFLFEYSNFILTLCVYFGIFTIIVFSLIGLFQNDIKKIIAYPTCSQLGYMILACGLSSYNLALFHLFNHAFFKALLSLSAGSIIHFMNNEQDLRRLTGIFKLLPLTSVCFLIGSLSLIGLPFLSGFYSKDPILELLFLKYCDKNFFVYVLANIGVFLTTSYSLKLMYYLFFKVNFINKINFKYFDKLSYFNPKINLYIFAHYLPLVALSFLSIFSGFIFKNLFLVSSDFFFNSILILPEHQIIDFEFTNFFVKNVPIFFIFTSLMFFYFFYYKKDILFFKKKKSSLNNLILFFNKRIYLDNLFNFFLSFFFYKLAYKVFFIFDKGIIEFIGPLGFSKILFKISFSILKSLHSGRIDNYLFFLFLIIFFQINFLFFIFF
jgi:NADH-ubiquinone oxidoreductase chain 5